MSLLLCRQEAVTRPYYMETLDIHLHSSQELCYVIFHHPLLVMDGFIDEGLVQFVRVKRAGRSMPRKKQIICFR